MYLAPLKPYLVKMMINGHRIETEEDMPLGGGRYEVTLSLLHRNQELAGKGTTRDYWMLVSEMVYHSSRGAESKDAFVEDGKSLIAWSVAAGQRLVVPMTHVGGGGGRLGNIYSTSRRPFLQNSEC
ncbi:hypothetical protein VTH06DRAFT_2287 [Thermothelomyces fergusii]